MRKKKRFPTYDKAEESLNPDACVPIPTVVLISVCSPMLGVAAREVNGFRGNCDGLSLKPTPRQTKGVDVNGLGSGTRRLFTECPILNERRDNGENLNLPPGFIGCSRTQIVHIQLSVTPVKTWINLLFLSNWYPRHTLPSWSPWIAPPDSRTVYV